MKCCFIYIIILIALAACNQKPAEKPVWVNKTDTLILPGAQLVFTTHDTNWNATLLTATQPIQLASTYSSTKLLAGLLHKKGITEGPAIICLQNELQYFYYPVYILNADTTAALSREYRSPKTVNPDSSLYQQRMVHSFDVHRNILRVQPGDKYFYEVGINLAPKAGVYRAVKKEPLSSFYVLAGSCTSIPVKATYKKEMEEYYVTAGPLKDKDNNTVANGTMVAFIYTDTRQTYRMEAPLLDGYVCVIIPSSSGTHYTLRAKINETVSQQINLIP